jgi:ornithine cyclodeaminase/alanine dehydrogenase
MALLLNRTDVQEVLTMAKAIDVVEAAFGELARATAEMPPRTVMIDPAVGGWIAYMPAYLKSGGSLGAKAVTVYKDNPEKFGLPTTIGTILVQNNETGEVVAAMDGGYLTAMRTGAVSGVATRHMARADSKIGGVLGAGIQARQQAVAISEASNVDTILTFSLDEDAPRREFADWVASQTGLDVRLARSGEELCRESDILALATTAVNPIVNADWWKPGAHINAIGSHAPGVRELDTATIQRARIICDQLEACMAEAGDLQIPVEEGDYDWSDVAGDLGDVVNGDTPGRISDEELTLFKSVGLAIQDISCADLVYREALANNIGQEFDFSA